MGRMFRVNSPAWAPFFDRSTARAFLKEVDAVLDARYEQHRIVKGTAEIDSEHGPRVLGLTNLAQLCNNAPRTQWRLLIYSHVSALDDLQPDRLDDLATSFDDIRDLLRLRVYPQDYAPATCEMVTFPAVPGLVTALVYDMPSTIATVGRDHLDRWPISTLDAFDLALANTATEEPTSFERVHQGDIDFLMAEGSSFFVASHLLHLDRLLPDVSEHGVVAAIPTRHSLFVRAIEEQDGLRASVAGVAMTANILFDEGPGSIDDDLFWWRPDHPLVRIPTGREGSDVTINPPAELADLLDRAGS